MSALFAAIFIPDFPLQAALRHEPELRPTPVALIDPNTPGPEIIELNSAAKTFGVVAGLTASQAMARCGRLAVKRRSPTQENAATEILLQTAFAFSPAIEATAPDVCTLDLKGLPEMTGHWGEKIIQTLASFRLEAKIGIATTPALALLAARGTDSIAIIENGRHFVSHLPVAALEPAAEISEILSRWGIRTVGELIALGKNEIAERLGPAVLELFERVSPDSVRPLKQVSPPETFSEQVEFDMEIETAPPLLFVLRRFVEQLSRRLETLYLVVASLRLRLGLSSGAKYERVFKIPSPTGDVEALVGMLRTHLDIVRTDSPIVSLRLDATPAMPDAHQFGLFESTLRNPNQFAETLARLTALVGAENVGTPVPEATHRPDAFQVQPPAFDSFRALNSKNEIRNSGPGLRRFRPPLPAQFEFREQKPVLIRSNFVTSAIAGSRGPFFSSGNWWDDRRWAREEWDVATADGMLLRIFRSNDGGFVEGIYD